MSAPSALTKGTTYNTAGVNTACHVIDLPDSLAAGNLLLMFFANDGANVSASFGTGWTQSASQDSPGSHGSKVAFRIADGTETTSCRVNTSASEQVIAFTWQINNWFGSGSPEVVSTSGSSASANPPSISPSWGAEDTTLFIAAFGINGGAGTVTYPTSYGDNQEANETGGAGASGAAICSRENNTATEDPGNFTQTSQQWEAWTIAIRPAAAAGGGAVIQPVMVRQQGTPPMPGFSDRPRSWN